MPPQVLSLKRYVQMYVTALKNFTPLCFYTQQKYSSTSTTINAVKRAITRTSEHTFEGSNEHTCQVWFQALATMLGEQLVV